MAKTDSEILNAYKARIKRQNDVIKDNYDKVTATLPKGTVNRIRALGLSINAAINKSLLVYLDCLEGDREGAMQDIFPNPQNAPESIAGEPKELSAVDVEKPEIEANTALQNGANVDTLSELQALIDQRKAEREEQRQKEADKSLEFDKILNGVLDGSALEGNSEKEALRQETIAKADRPF